MNPIPTSRHLALRRNSLSTSPWQTSEICLALAFMVALLTACFGPALAQFEHYHQFADQRIVVDIRYGMDVLSNLPFFFAGAWGLMVLHRGRSVLRTDPQAALAGVFFCGLIVASLCSVYYHLQPNDASLVVDRLGMLMAFAGLLGLGVADRISPRAALATLVAVVCLGPLAIAVWADSGNLLPWSVLQGGGMLLLMALACCKPQASRWSLALGAVVAIYATAKLMELGDYPLFAATQGALSGHSVKHIVAALAAWPVISAIQNQVKINRALAALRGQAERGKRLGTVGRAG